MRGRSALSASELENARVERYGEGLLVTFDSGLLYDYDSDVVKPTARAPSRTAMHIMTMSAHSRGGGSSECS